MKREKAIALLDTLTIGKDSVTIRANGITISGVFTYAHTSNKEVMVGLGDDMHLFDVALEGVSMTKTKRK